MIQFKLRLPTINLAILNCGNCSWYGSCLISCDYYRVIGDLCLISSWKLYRVYDSLSDSMDLSNDLPLRIYFFIFVVVRRISEYGVLLLCLNEFGSVWLIHLKVYSAFLNTYSFCLILTYFDSCSLNLLIELVCLSSKLFEISNTNIESYLTYLSSCEYVLAIVPNSSLDILVSATWFNYLRSTFASKILLNSPCLK